MKNVEIHFADEKVLRDYNGLLDERLKRFIDAALNEIRKNVFCGIQIQKRLIPKEYIVKFNVRNLWRYNLPNAHRLLYSIEGGVNVVIAVVLEWMTHK